MELPLISHPADEEADHAYQPDQLTVAGDLLLTAHSEVVAERATRLFGPDDERAIYMRATAALHDFGKATPQFQAYVRNDETYTGPEKEKHHARLGALATWFVLGHLEAPSQDRLAATLAVARHHQALPNAAAYTTETLADAFNGTVIQTQCERISEEWPMAATEMLQLSGTSGITWEDFAEWVDSGSVVDELHVLSARKELTGPKPDSNKLPKQLYDRTLHYWAALTLADKSHAMDIPEEYIFDLATLDRNTIEEYIADLRNNPPTNDLEAALNDERERARRQAIRGVHKWLDGGSAIATLTLPTGLGKTFTGLSAAFEARDLLSHQSEDDHSRPIIYALPYTSIIEQTRAIFEDPDLWGADPTKSALTVHHYLSETVVYHDEHTADDVDDSDAEETAHLLAEAWRDGTVLTTFVQLFESVTGPSNRQGLKLAALDGGLVILDEPQALPKDWWDGITRLLDLLTEEYQTRVIAMTATQPSLLREIDTTSLLNAGLDHDVDSCTHCRAGRSYSRELTPASKEAYFEGAERVRYTIDDTALSHQLSADRKFIDYETAAKRLCAATTADGSTLAICNTIESSKVLTEAVCDHDDITHLGPAIEAVLRKEDHNAVSQKVSAQTVTHEVLTGLGIDVPTDEEVEWTIPTEPETLMLTLNSRYRPHDRRILIELADLLSTSPLPFLLVSTQAIEAGVDLSFKTVFRDIAPLDSIVQAAGRCNRSYEWGRNGGRVVIWTLTAPDAESASAAMPSPPAHYVYERGSTDAGIPGHLQLISDVLADVEDPADVPDAEFSRHAVDTYFEALQRKSLGSTNIRQHINDAKAQWLAGQSLIGGCQTVDVLVAISDAEKDWVNKLTERFTHGEPTAYEKLEAASSIRVSLPAETVEEVPEIARLDGKDRSAEGVQVFRYTGDSGLQYTLADGGLQGNDNAVSDRFTVI